MNEQNNKNEISSQRKGVYYLGMALLVIGVLMFMSTFLLLIMNPFGGLSAFMNAPIGVIMIIIGNILMTVGRRGLAGSGIILDPNKAREDLKPYSRQAGAMINDVLEEVEVLHDTKESSQTVKVRCRNCKSLNDESAKYCNQCGEEL